jgi:protein-L-isoaspartate(D-aspartate) O-methyltransferase
MRDAKQLAGIGMTSQRTRERMVDRLREKGIRDETVLSAMSAVPRHVFVEEALASRAYEDTALPIGSGQTISQPYVVAKMIEALRAGGRPLGRVLEIGTGCGYQAAVLAHVAPEVYTIERIQALLDRARRNLLGLKLSNLRVIYGDGNLGLEKAAPFDSIIVAAAAPEVPPALLQQIAPGGRMILPLKTPQAGRGTQQLVMIERGPRGFTETTMDAVRFVPLETGRL